MEMTWRESSHPARLEERLDQQVVRCHLSPRNCTLKPGQHGFCGVRKNIDGRLVTLNYGKSVQITEETIETEAVNHYAPGERILSLGNIGCMLNCSYCHNWKTSQAKHVEDKDVFHYTPEKVVALARQYGIRVLSWTYNDPVVWHEFVRDTSALARQQGLINLYKSAFYITPEAIDELLPVIDIFSISLKSWDPAYYKKYTKGELEPVLEGIKRVHRAGKHLELSTLMITGVSDNEETARKISSWVLENVGSTTPLHFVRFHPDYRMRDTIRTPIPNLIRAREIALEMGVEHVYLGNVYDTPFSNTFCRGCDQLLVDRYGLNAWTVGLDDAGRCTRCQRDAHVKFLKPAIPPPSLETLPAGNEMRSFAWHGDIRSLHVVAANDANQPVEIYHRRTYQDARSEPWRVVPLEPGQSFRFSLAKGHADEVGPVVAFPPSVRTNLHEVFDRAHFPTVSVEQAMAPDDRVPLPIFQPSRA